MQDVYADMGEELGEHVVPETVSLSITIPRSVHEFLSDLLAMGASTLTVREYIEHEVSFTVPDTLLMELSGLCFDRDAIRKKYNLPSDGEA